MKNHFAAAQLPRQQGKTAMMGIRMKVEEAVRLGIFKADACRDTQQHFNNYFFKPLLNEVYAMNKSQNGAAKKEPKKTMAQLKQDIEILQAKLEVAEKNAATWMRTAEDRQKNGAKVAEESLMAAVRLKNIDLMCNTYLQTAHPTQYDSMAERDKRMNMFSGGDGYREIRAHPNNSVTRFINEILSITSHPKELSQHIEP